jgi:acyl-CoA synthetase (AMP-forming)/AMP-acid ligase II
MTWCEHATSPLHPSTLTDLLRWRALEQPEQCAYMFLKDGETEEVRLTYGELDRQARAIAAHLQSLGACGERVLLLYPCGLEYIAAFFGCLYAGAVAVPAYPPRLNRSVERLQAIVRDADATMVLTARQCASKTEPWLAQTIDLGRVCWLHTDILSDDAADAWQHPAIDSQTLAFLQYTSGSTGDPKGVMLNHGNLLHNVHLIQSVFQQTTTSILVSWLPLYHDMGLIGGLLEPLYAGYPCVLMSPMAFLQRPVRWLQAITRYQATTSGGPNFAYDLCVRRVTPAQRATLDLSSWEVAFNGAEPVRSETLERFTAAFAPCGFRRQAFHPCYGLAEATLMVTGSQKGIAPVVQTVQKTALEQHHVIPTTPANATGQTLVSCGRVFVGQQLAIVDPETHRRCQPGHVGELWVAGPSVAQGYWQRPEETAQTFQAHLADTGAGPFMRTGDLGFIWQDELFVTGRLKDVIIIRGSNHYPQDIELVVEQSHPSLRPGCGAAFSVEVDGEERLVVVHEVERRYQPPRQHLPERRQVHVDPGSDPVHPQPLQVDVVIGDIRQAVAGNHGLQTHAVLLLRAGSIPKTSSGKIQRHACRAGFLNHTLEVVGCWEAEAILASPGGPAPAVAHVVGQHGGLGEERGKVYVYEQYAYRARKCPEPHSRAA